LDARLESVRRVFRKCLSFTPREIQNQKDAAASSQESSLGNSFQEAAVTDFPQRPGLQELQRFCFLVGKETRDLSLPVARVRSFGKNYPCRKTFPTKSNGVDSEQDWGSGWHSPTWLSWEPELKSIGKEVALKVAPCRKRRRRGGQDDQSSRISRGKKQIGRNKDS
jgi:hypothetical protein